MSDNRARGVLDGLSRLDRIYAVTANKLANLAEEYGDRPNNVAELARDLADEYKRIDPSFDRTLFLNIADPD